MRRLEWSMSMILAKARTGHHNNLTFNAQNVVQISYRRRRQLLW